MDKQTLAQQLLKIAKNLAADEYEVNPTKEDVMSYRRQLSTIFDTNFSIDVKDITNKLVKIETIKINPSDLGVLAPVFDNIEVEISIGKALVGALIIELHYSWKYVSGGTNGVTIKSYTEDGKHWTKWTRI